MANITLKQINKTYDNNIKAVDNIDLVIEDKEFMVFVGPSGCGKTTILRMIAGLETITSGEIYLDGKLINDVLPKERDIAMVFQNYALFPHMSVYQNMVFGLKQHRLEDVMSQTISDTASILGLEEILERKPNTLSGGQRQRVSIARAIVRAPKILLMDEPLSNLDATLRLQMRLELVKLHQKLKATILYVTHDQTEAMTLGTKIVVMNKGCIQQIDTPRNLYQKPANQFVAGFIGSPAMNFITCEVKVVKEVICLVFGGHELILNQEKGQRLKRGGYLNKSVIMGIRPEDLHESSTAQSKFQWLVKAKVMAYELVGKESYLYFELHNKTLVVCVSPQVTHKVDDELELYINDEAIHLFDVDTSLAIG